MLGVVQKGLFLCVMIVSLFACGGDDKSVADVQSAVDIPVPIDDIPEAKDVGSVPDVEVIVDLPVADQGIDEGPAILDEGSLFDPGQPMDQGGEELPVEPEDVEGIAEDVPVVPTGPTIMNYSTSSDQHVQSLVSQAISGLGFPEDSIEGPQDQDLYFVGRFYIAWVDQTGFTGTMNGLWRLNGEQGDALDFSVKNGPQAVNFLIVGENGSGQFPPGYPGAEHIETPNRTPEANDDPACGSGDWCNQYGLDNAVPITDPDIPWWSACNSASMAWDKLTEPISEQSIDGGVKLVWEAPLVKRADGDGNWDGDDCNQHWLFPDGVRRPVFLQVGFEFFANEMHLIRTMKFRNPEVNPEFDAPMGAIGGFVITQWPNPHPMKQIDRWIRPIGAPLFDTIHNMNFAANQWNDHNHPPADGDEVYGWIGNPISLSAFANETAGRTATISHVGEIDNDDVGICLCKVHGAIEMGGGLLHSGSSLPIAGNSSSPEARRKLELPGSPPEPVITKVFTYEAESDLQHAVGAAEEDGWSANVADFDAGHIVYGPYTAEWTGDVGTAEFTMMIDIIDSDDMEIVILEVYDATADEVLNSRSVTRGEFQMNYAYQTFGFDFSLFGKAGHLMEVRAFWKDISYLKVDKVVITTSE